MSPRKGAGPKAPPEPKPPDPVEPALRALEQGPVALAEAVSAIASAPFSIVSTEPRWKLAEALPKLGLDSAATQAFVGALSELALLMLVGCTPEPLGAAVFDEALRRCPDDAWGVLSGGGRRTMIPEGRLPGAVVYACERHGGWWTKVVTAAELATKLDAAARASLTVKDPIGAALVGGDQAPLVAFVREKFATAFGEEQRSEVERSARGSEIAYGLSTAPEPLPTAARLALASLAATEPWRVRDILDSYPTLG